MTPTKTKETRPDDRDEARWQAVPLPVGGEAVAPALPPAGSIDLLLLSPGFFALTDADRWLARLGECCAPGARLSLALDNGCTLERMARLLATEQQFTADAAHELRTPIAGIRMQAQVAQGASEATERSDALAATGGWPAVHAELAKVDPVTAARLAPNDSQRIQRALEVWHVSGRPLSSFHTIKTEAYNARPISDTSLFSLEPENRTWLHERIAQRFHAMLAAGFLDEVLRLRARGDLHPDLPSMRCVGYRQVWEELDWQEKRGKPDLNLPLLRDKGIAATRQLAKRQITWLRSMPQRHVIACDHPHAVAHLVQAVLQRLEQRTP